MAYKMKEFSGFKSSPTKALDPGGSYKKASIAKKLKVKDMPRKQQMAVKASMAEQSPAKMKLGASVKVPKKKKIKVSFKPSLSKPKGDGLVPIGKGGAMNAIKSLQKKETQAKTGREKAKIRKSIAAARKEYNHPIYNQ